MKSAGWWPLIMTAAMVPVRATVPQAEQIQPPSTRVAVTAPEDHPGPESAGLFVPDPPVSSPASEPADFPTEARIRAAIRRLDHPLPGERAAAVEQLALWGPCCLPALAGCIRTGRLEPALSARDLLIQLRSLYLLGARVHLRVSRAQVAWDEPFDLIVEVSNPTPGPLLLPWPESPAPADGPWSADAAQVAAFLDAAEILSVIGPAGTSVETRMDPIDRDPAVEWAVHLRSGDQPPAHRLPPGASARLIVPDFNRGWARALMLEAGIYRISVQYQPQWGNPAWTGAGFGRVTSPPVEVVVIRAAPEAIRLFERPLTIEVAAEGDRLTARLVSRWDRPVWINGNLGPDPTVHAQLTWTFAFDGPGDSYQWQPEPRDPSFREEALVRLDPLEALELHSVDLADLHRIAARVGDPRRCSLRVSYLQLATADRLQRRLARREPALAVPTGLFSGSVTSETVRLPALPPQEEGAERSSAISREDPAAASDRAPSPP